MDGTLASHVRSSLVIKLNKSRSHDGKPLGVLLVFLDLDVQAGELLAAPIDGVDFFTAKMLATCWMRTKNEYQLTV